MFKKALSLLLALMLIVTSVSITAISVTAAEDDATDPAATWYVVGSSADLFGATWSDAMIDRNAMTANGDGTYTKVYENVGPIDKVVSLKVTNGTDWIGTKTGNDIAIEVIGTGKITVTFDPKLVDGDQVKVTGDNVKLHELNPAAVQEMRVVGSGQGGFLNDLSWDVAADANKMKEIATGVYQIVFDDVASNDAYQFKFAANGSWTDNFGAAGNTVVGKDNAAKYDGDNICFEVPENGSTVTITLDMSKFDFRKGNFDASYEINVVGSDGQEFIPEKATAKASAQDPSTAPAEETTAVTHSSPEPVGDSADEKLVVIAKSNITPTYTQTFDPTTNQVTVTYWIEMTEKWMINAQWTMTYDKEFLTVDMTDGVNGKTKKGKFIPSVFYVTEGNGTIVNFEPESLPNGGIKANASDLNGFDLCTEKGGRIPFVSVTFNPTGKAGNTEVNLDVEIMNVQGEGESRESYFINNSVIVQEIPYLPKETPVAVYAGVTDPDYVAPVQPTTVQPTTVQPTTVQPTTVQPTTVQPTTVQPTTVQPTTAPAGKNLNVHAFSNSKYYKETTQSYAEPNIPQKVTVNFYIDTDAYQMINGQFELHYDPAVLSLKEENNKSGRTTTLSPAAVASGAGVVSYWDNLKKEPILPINFSSITDGGIYLTDEKGKALPVISAVFEVIGEGNTDVYLDTQIITLNDYGQPADPDTWHEANKNSDKYEATLAEFDKKADMRFEILPEGTPVQPTTVQPTTVAPTTVAPTTVAPTTVAPTTVAPTTVAPTTIAPTTVAPTTVAPTTVAPTTVAPTTVAPTTVAPTTVAPTTVAPTTVAPTTVAPTTVAPTTVAPTTVAPTTLEQTLSVAVNTQINAAHIPTVPSSFALQGANPVVSKVGDEFTMIWKLDTDGNDVESLQWIFEYNPNVMQLVKAEMPQITTGAMINSQTPGVIKASASNINGYTIDKQASFITLVFKATGVEFDVKANMLLDELAYVPVVEPTTVEPTTVEPTTVEPTTVEPTTVAPTTVEPTTVAPTTVEPTTVAPTTVEPTTVEPTTVAPTTVEPTTVAPTTVEPTTVEPTPVAPTTVEPTTVAPTTVEPTTVAPTTEPTSEPVSVEPTTTPDATSETVAPTTTSGSTSDSATKDSSGTNSNGSGTVKTGSASMAVIILLVLVSATVAVYFVRRRDRK